MRPYDGYGQCHSWVGICARTFAARAARRRQRAVDALRLSGCDERWTAAPQRTAPERPLLQIHRCASLDGQRFRIPDSQFETVLSSSTREHLERGCMSSQDWATA